MTKDLVTDFFLPPYGHSRFPNFPEDKFMISMEFEVGGAYEDWGWIMYQKYYDKENKVQTYKTFCTARTLKDLIEKAEKLLT